MGLAPHRILVGMIGLFLSLTPRLSAETWSQWGGPQRDFQVRGSTLDSWPAEGPKEIWNRPLGAGYSSILAVDGKLFTIYREEEEEVVVALSTETGETLWSHRYDAGTPENMRLGFGTGPHATPLWEKGRLFTVGTAGRLWALDAETGKPLWQKDLWQGLGGTFLYRGYGSSPIVVDDTVVVSVGGEERGAVAFSQKDGAVVWESPPFANSQSSPVLIDLEGHRQLVFFVNDEVVGVDATQGSLLWRHPHPSSAAYNLSTPIWRAEERQLFISSSYGGGSRVLRLSREGEETQVEELWASKRLRIHFTNALLLDDVVYASHGGPGAVLSMAVDFETGELVWRDRAVKRANFLAVGNQVLILEADGRLLLARMSRDGLTIVSEHQLFEEKSWTVPTLLGNRLFVRNEERILALELPVEAP